MATLGRVIIVLWCIMLSVAHTLAEGSGNVVLRAHVNDYSDRGYSDCWGYVAPDGSEYALLGVADGTSVIDVTNADDAIEVDFVAGPLSPGRDIKTFQHYAYVVTETGPGMQIIDLSELPASALVVATCSAIGSAHNIFIDEENSLLFAEGVAAEPVRIFSLEDPLLPQELSTVGIDCHDMFAQNGLLYVAEGAERSIGIYDINDPVHPALLTRIDIPAGGFTHGIGVSDDGRHLFSTESNFGKTVKMWDIADYGDVEITDDYLAPDGLAHNVYYKENYAYITHNSDGLRILNVSDPNNVIEEGYFDTYPDPGVGSVGAWGAYPYFESGKILISDRSSGLYVVFFLRDVNLTDVTGPEVHISEFSLAQNYPNPFNPSTVIEYRLPLAANVSIKVYDASGRFVRELVDESTSAGIHTATWDGKDRSGAPVSTGMYFYRLEVVSSSGDVFTQTRKMLLMQ